MDLPGLDLLDPPAGECELWSPYSLWPDGRCRRGDGLREIKSHDNQAGLSGATCCLQKARPTYALFQPCQPPPALPPHDLK